MGCRINERNTGSYTLDGELKVRRSKRLSLKQLKKAIQLESQLQSLQGKIYNLQSELEDLNENSVAELVGMAGFELDESQNKMNDAISRIRLRTN
jgi:TolA-binding protein